MKWPSFNLKGAGLYMKLEIRFSFMYQKYCITTSIPEKYVCPSVSHPIPVLSIQTLSNQDTFLIKDVRYAAVMNNPPSA